MKSLSRVRPSATPWTAAFQAPPSMGFPRQEYWSGVPFPSPGDLLDPGIELASLAWQADSLRAEPRGKPFCTVEWKVKYLPYKDEDEMCLTQYPAYTVFSE